MSAPAETDPLDDEAARANLPAGQFDRGWIMRHLAGERRKASLLGEIREAIFGAQDGLVSTLAVASTVAGGSPERFSVLLGGGGAPPGGGVSPGGGRGAGRERHARELVR